VAFFLFSTHPLYKIALSYTQYFDIILPHLPPLPYAISYINRQYMLYIYVLLSAFLQHLWTIWTANQNSVLLVFTGQHKQCWFLIRRRVRRQIWHCNEHYFCRSHDPLSANDCQHFWWWYNNKTVYTMLAYDAHWDQMLFTAHGIFLVLMVDHIHSVL